jgi:F0F1-type ATP synthase gamma subunit
MAITWDVQITPLDVPHRIAGIVAVATDNTSGATYAVSLANADISTTAKKTEVLNTIWNKYLTKVAEQALLDSIAGEIASLEAAAKVNLEGRTI